MYQKALSALGFILAFSFAVLVGLVAWLVGYPRLMYQAVSGALVALLGVLVWRKAQAGTVFLVASLLWYAMFWVVRDSFAPFYTAGTDLQNFMSILPVLVATIYCVWPLVGPWWYVGAAVVHWALTTWMHDTNNELLVVAGLIGVIMGRNMNMRIVSLGFVWYQVWMAASKYMAFGDMALLYSLALGPYLTALIVALWRRIQQDGATI